MKAVLFDLDGTLIDSIELIVSCFTKAIETHVNYTPERSWIYSCIGKPLRPALESVAPGKSAILFETYKAHQDLLHDTLVRPFAGIEDVLFSLCEKGLQIGVVTSKGREGTDKALALMPETKDLFSTVITVDDSPTHKPDGGPLLMGLEQINQKKKLLSPIIPSECYYVGDTIYDMQASLSAGMKPVGVLWGVADKPALSTYTETILSEVDEMRSF